jgi:hypothetical protein
MTDDEEARRQWEEYKAREEAACVALVQLLTILSPKEMTPAGVIKHITPEVAKDAVILLRALIGAGLGESLAQFIFVHFGNPLTPAADRRAKNNFILHMYDNMPKPNVEQLAKTIAAKNKILPKEGERIGTGSEDWTVVAKQIRRLKDRRGRTKL